MEDYKKIYPELPKEPPKDGNAFRLQESCRVLENLEKEAKHYASVRKKVQKMLQLIVEKPAHYQELFRFVSAGLELEQHFLGLACLSPHHLEALVLFVEF